MAKWTTEQVEAVLTGAREMGRWRGGSPEQHMLCALADVADWLLEESRAQRVALRAQLAEALSGGETDPARLRLLAALADRGPSEEDEDDEAGLEASVRAVRAEHASLEA